MIEAKKIIKLLEHLSGSLSFKDIGTVQMTAFSNDRTLQMVAVSDSIENAAGVILSKIESGRATISSRLRIVLSGLRSQYRIELEKARGNEEDPKVLAVAARIDRIATQLGVVDPSFKRD